jgi:hypothetical protein
MSDLIPYLDSWDARDLPRPMRRYLTDEVARGLITILSEQGIKVSVSHSLQTLSDLQAAAGDRWPRLAEPCDPSLNPNASARDTFALIVQRANSPIACAAMRLKPLEGNLATHIASQTLLAERPDLLPPGQQFQANGFIEKISDVPIAWGSSLWAYQGVPKIVVPILMRLLHLYSIAHWFWTYSISIAQPRIADHYGLDIHGYEMVTRFVRRSTQDGKTTDYRVLIAGRDHIRKLVAHPGFIDPATSLSTLDLSASRAA